MGRGDDALTNDPAQCPVHVGHVVRIRLHRDETRPKMIGRIVGGEAHGLVCFFAERLPADADVGQIWTARVRRRAGARAATVSVMRKEKG